MTQQGLHRLGIRTRVDQKSCKRMPKVMETKPRPRRERHPGFNCCWTKVILDQHVCNSGLLSLSPSARKNPVSGPRIHTFLLPCPQECVTEALRRIATESFDVLITDLHMPDPGDGFTAVSAMRHSQPNALTMLVSNQENS
jgi:hypothetical protein